MFYHTSLTHTYPVVDALEHPEAVLIQRTLKGKAELSSILIDDEDNIIQALKAGVKLERLFFTADMPPSDTLKSLLAPDTPQFEVTRRTAKKLFQTSRWSRSFATAQRPKTMSLADIATLPKDLIVLETPGIAGNVGAMIRTALAFDTGAVILLDSELDPYDRRLIRASRGYVFSLPVIRATTDALVDFCGRYDWHLTVTQPQVLDDVQSLSKMQQRLAICFGSEKAGCSERLRKVADFQIGIPTRAGVESLNVSVAAAIVLFCRFHPRVFRAAPATL